MIYVLIALLAPIFHSISCIFDSHFANNVFKRPATLVFYSSITNILIIPFILLIGTPSVPSASVFAVISLVAFIDVFYLFPWYAALKRADTSISVALFSLGKIAVPIFAWLIVGEKLHWSQYLGFGIIVASSFVLNFDRKKLKLNAAFYLMFAVSLALSLAGVLNKFSLERESFVTVMFWSTLLSTALSLLFLIPSKMRAETKNEFPTYKKRFRFFILNETLVQAGDLAALVALSHLPVLAAKSISSSQPIFTLVFGFVLYKIFGDRFRENLGRAEIVKKLMFFVFIMIGIAMVL